MRQKKKSAKLWMVLALMVSMITVQVMQVMAEENTETGDLKNQPIVVNDRTELEEALLQVEDGGIIEIGSVININYGTIQMGEAGGKRFSITRTNEYACIEIGPVGNVTMCNMIIDGNASVVNGQRSMLHVAGQLHLNDVVIQNCSHAYSGGAVFVESSGSFTTEEVVFEGNYAGQSGGHIYAAGSINLSNTVLKNGTAAMDGGAIRVDQGGSAILNSCKCYENKASAYGGAVSNKGTVSITHTVIFGNSATAGSDLANESDSVFSMDNSDMTTFYEEMGVTPTGWIFDCAEITPEISSAFDTADEISLMKMLYEEYHPDNGGDTGDQGGGGTDGDSENQGEGETGGDSGGQSGSDDRNDSENQDGSGDNVGNDKDAVSDNSPNKGEDSNTGGNQSPDADSSDKGSSGNNVPNSVVTNSEDNSRTNNTEDHSTTTTNNYYTYNTPAGTDSSSAKSEAVAQGTTEATTQETVAPDSEFTVVVPNNVQVPDNIKLNLSNVNIIYNMTDGISNIEISNEQAAMGTVMLAENPLQTEMEMSSSAVAKDSPSVDWYEVVKMVLLAAIFLVVVPKPQFKRKDK